MNVTLTQVNFESFRNHKNFISLSASFIRKNCESAVVASSRQDEKNPAEGLSR